MLFFFFVPPAVLVVFRSALVRQGHDACVRVLLQDRRVDPAQPLGGSVGGGARPLTIAADRNRAAVLALLLADSRVDPNATTDDGATALFVACQVSSLSSSSSSSFSSISPRFGGLCAVMNVSNNEGGVFHSLRGFGWDATVSKDVLV
jgi:hypothetical protein